MIGTPPRDGRGSGSPRERLWTAAAGASLGLGLVCALIDWGVWVWVYGVIAVAMLAILMAPHSGGPGVRRPIWTATRVVAAVVATFGLVAALGWAGLAWVLMVAATHPALGRWLSRGLGEDGTAAAGVEVGDTLLSRTAAWPQERGLAGPAPELPSAATVRGLDDEALCRAWRCSFVQLSATSLPTRRMEIVALRQLYLDELARRHPAAVQRWLASGARAASNPMPFVEQASRGGRSESHDSAT
jgi:hypothetical protein